ncbi:MAG TPA: hypothetical protein DET40_02875 [Lentisphaeria bacterium]|nr:MAG: hypothetical protein A2X45_14060 [Lentisphaerae bacterium GWF2_50_93]HCE42473.1 hypothetical protein [Lentisphaeria bacterium]
MNFEKYILKNRGRHRIGNTPVRRYKNAIVIPAFSEFQHLPPTLKSLSENHPAILDETMIITVVNNPPADSAGPDKLRENAEMLDLMRNSQFPCQDRLQLFWIDASSHGHEINPKEGVGAARKIGMDAALEFLDFERGAPLIISLDADTLVERNYLEAINEYFMSNAGIAGAAIEFAHQPGSTPEEDAAITRYELFMRYYVEGLQISQSPYAYHVLGSAMAFRAEEYVRAGGMRKRNGGEDFYFMQALRKIGEVGEIRGTTVFPSSRPSDRVPFGTGPRISQILEGGKELKFYNPCIFLLLKKLFSAIKSVDVKDPCAAFNGLDGETGKFLAENNFFHEWEKILKNTPNDKMKIQWAFHTWFDAFRTLKFVHSCEDRYPELGLMEAYARLFDMAGKPLPETIKPSEKALLEFMRRKNI